MRVIAFCSWTNSSTIGSKWFQFLTVGLINLDHVALCSVKQLETVVNHRRWDILQTAPMWFSLEYDCLYSCGGGAARPGRWHRQCSWLTVARSRYNQNMWQVYFYSEQHILPARYSWTSADFFDDISRSGLAPASRAPRPRPPCAYVYAKSLRRFSMASCLAIAWYLVTS